MTSTNTASPKGSLAVATAPDGAQRLRPQIAHRKRVQDRRAMDAEMARLLEVFAAVCARRIRRVLSQLIEHHLKRLDVNCATRRFFPQFWTRLSLPKMMEVLSVLDDRTTDDNILRERLRCKVALGKTNSGNDANCTNSMQGTPSWTPRLKVSHAAQAGVTVITPLKCGSLVVLLMPKPRTLPRLMVGEIQGMFEFKTYSMPTSSRARLPASFLTYT